MSKKPRRKRKTPTKAVLPKGRLEKEEFPMIPQATEPVEVSTSKPKPTEKLSQIQKLISEAPTFPPEINYYVAEHIEKFRADYKNWLNKLVKASQ